MGAWKFCATQEDACYKSDAIIIITEWGEFKTINWDHLRKVMRPPSWLFDTRNIANHKKAESAGFKVWKLGYGNF